MGGIGSYFKTDKVLFEAQMGKQAEQSVTTVPEDVESADSVKESPIDVMKRAMEDLDKDSIQKAYDNLLSDAGRHKDDGDSYDTFRDEMLLAKQVHMDFNVSSSNGSELGQVVDDMVSVRNKMQAVVDTSMTEWEQMDRIEHVHELVGDTLSDNRVYAKKLDLNEAVNGIVTEDFEAQNNISKLKVESYMDDYGDIVKDLYKDGQIYLDHENAEYHTGSKDKMPAELKAIADLTNAVYTGAPDYDSRVITDGSSVRFVNDIQEQTERAGIEPQVTAGATYDNYMFEQSVRQLGINELPELTDRLYEDSLRSMDKVKKSAEMGDISSMTTFVDNAAQLAYHTAEYTTEDGNSLIDSVSRFAPDDVYSSNQMVSELVDDYSSTKKMLEELTELHTKQLLEPESVSEEEVEDLADNINGRGYQIEDSLVEQAHVKVAEAAVISYVAEQIDKDQDDLMGKTIEEMDVSIAAKGMTLSRIQPHFPNMDERTQGAFETYISVADEFNERMEQAEKEAREEYDAAKAAYDKYEQEELGADGPGQSEQAVSSARRIDEGLAAAEDDLRMPSGTGVSEQYDG